MPESAAASRTMTKADLVERVYDNVGFSKKEALELIDAVFETMREALERGEKIKVSGFGNFVVRQKSARRGRNPQTNESIVIEPRRVLTFKPSQVLKTAINGSLRAEDVPAAGPDDMFDEE
ncbi:MAG: integration host factor subunit alpha [Deltaproteobacteria bacterium]|jgi:integration host factor subunit alpha|nr:integration host factor subunit alpha [Deltaproteobacteria bacterium]MBK9371378.1 integration host factor subunit alpha [Deltaproteobacteria bacterium]MBK9647844.1 integration host factor subunit alpha [Deltaproteobacteria bacterium]